MPDYGFLAQGAGPLDQLGKLATVQNQVNQNLLFQGRQAAGQALQQSIDPSTGQIDFNNVNRLIQANPKIAPYAQQAVSEALAARGQSITNQTGQTALQTAYAQNFRKLIASVPPGPNQAQQALRAVQTGIDSGLFPADFAASMVGGMSLPDGTTMHDLIRQSAIASGDAAEQSAQFGDVANIDNGATIQPTAINRVAGTTAAVGAPITKTLTPEAAAHPQTVIANGVPSTVPTSALVTDTGQPRPDNGLTGPHGEVKASFTPAEQAAGAATGAGLAGIGVGIVQRASKVPDNKAALGTLGGLLDTPNLVLGPQSGGWNKLQQLAAQYGLAQPGSQPADAAAAKEQVTKLAMMIAQNQFQAMGGTGTDAKLDSALHTSPSEFLTKQGNKQIIAMLKGNEDAYQRYAEAWQKWQETGHGPESLGQFQAQWNRLYDPRVFQSAYMSSEERQAMLKGMTPAELDQFKGAYKRAHSLGWVQ